MLGNRCENKKTLEMAFEAFNKYLESTDSIKTELEENAGLSAGYYFDSLKITHFGAILTVFIRSRAIEADDVIRNGDEAVIYWSKNENKVYTQEEWDRKNLIIELTRNLEDLIADNEGHLIVTSRQDIATTYADWFQEMSKAYGLSKSEIENMLDAALLSTKPLPWV